MSISLRIVGTFYQRDDINTGSATVQEVLDYAVSNPNGTMTSSACDNFKYISGTTAPTVIAGRKPSVTAFFANYKSDIVSPVSGIQYPKGEYFLPESLVNNPSYEVWQYYVFDKPMKKGGNFIKRSTPIESYVDAKVPDGGEVVWRLVKILTRPNDAPAVYRPAFGLGPLVS